MVRDLLALSTIPQAWVGQETLAIAGGLADLLIDSLNLDFVFVRLRDPTQGDATEVTRGNSAQPFPDWLRTRIGEIGHLSRTEILSNGAGEPYCGVAIPIGVSAEGGLVVAACRRTDFPSDTDALLLPVAANHAATAFQNACLRKQLHAKVVELGHAHDDLELKVEQRTLENTRLYGDLEERDKKIRRLVDANIVGVSVATLEGQIIEANDALLNMLGYNRDDLISGRLNWTELTPPDWRAVTEQALAQIAAQGTCGVYEKEYLRKDGSRVPVLIAAAAVEETAGEIVSFVLDLTERKRAEHELAASRRRIVAASDDARRRIERNLHDGTQQRLVSLGLAVRAAEANLAPERQDVKDQLSRVAIGLADAVEDLQEISRGIHPAILSRGGLGPALQTLAYRSAIPVDLQITMDARLEEPIEVAAYFVGSEALANAAKHSEASRIDVSLSERNGSLVLSVRDDGIGGADAARGSGIVGLNDRVEALGGSLQVDSRPGEGTQIVAQLPLDLELERPV
jgi:PAS domain S-box-containing protein